MRHTTTPASPEAGSSAGDADFWPSDRRGIADRKGLIALIVGGVILLAGAVVAFFVLRGGGESDEVTVERLRPTSFTPSPVDQGTAKINLRKADSRRLNEGEVFTSQAKTASYRNYTFALAGSKASDDCTGVTLGKRLREDLSKHGCTQIVRGAYLSSDKRYVGQFIVINLETVDGAQQIVRDLDPQYGDGVVLPLQGKGISKFGGGFSAAYAKPFGHYVLMTWVQRNGGVQPKSMNEMIDTSLAIEGAADGFAWQRLILAGG